MTVAKLLETLQALEPTDELIRSRVGNISVIRNNQYIGFIDTIDGAFDKFNPEGV